LRMGANLPGLAVRPVRRPHWIIDHSPNMRVPDDTTVPFPLVSDGLYVRRLLRFSSSNSHLNGACPTDKPQPKLGLDVQPAIRRRPDVLKILVRPAMYHSDSWAASLARSRAWFSNTAFRRLSSNNRPRTPPSPSLFQVTKGLGTPTAAGLDCGDRLAGVWHPATASRNAQASVTSALFFNVIICASFRGVDSASGHIRMPTRRIHLQGISECNTSHAGIYGACQTGFSFSSAMKRCGEPSGRRLITQRVFPVRVGHMKVRRPILLHAQRKAQPLVLVVHSKAGYGRRARPAHSASSRSRPACSEPVSHPCQAQPTAGLPAAVCHNQVARAVPANI